MIDQTDIKLLNALQQDAQITAHQLAELLNLSPSQAGRRRQKLEAQGYVCGYTARLDAHRLGLGVQAFVQVHLGTHGPQQAQSFARLVAMRSEITSAWTLTGDYDYLLRIYCADLASLNSLIHEVLLPHPAILRVQSQIVMDHVKPDSPLPLTALPKEMR